MDCGYMFICNLLGETRFWKHGKCQVSDGSWFWAWSPAVAKGAEQFALVVGERILIILLLTSFFAGFALFGACLGICSCAGYDVTAWCLQNSRLAPRRLIMSSLQTNLISCRHRNWMIGNWNRVEVEIHSITKMNKLQMYAKRHTANIKNRSL